MHITQMLKSEDKRIKNAKHRINATDILTMSATDILNKIINKPDIKYPTLYP